MSVIASWRTALRIARREARRAKGRSALVILMIAVPVLALTVAAVTYDMFNLTPAEDADRTMGTADARIQWPNRLPVNQPPDPRNAVYGRPVIVDEIDEQQLRPGTTEELLAALPGATAIPLHRGAVAVRTKDGVGQPNAIAVDATNSLTEGYVEILAGRAPWAEDEVALSEQAADRLGQGIGGTVVSADGKRSYTVVGLVEFPSLLEEVLLFPGTDEVPENFVASYDHSWLVRTPTPITWDQVRELNQSGIVVLSRAVLLDPPSVELPEDVAVPREVGFGVLVGGLALLEIVLLAGPAFAVSARRRQRQLALVAATGGTPAHVRRIVFADGVVLGAVGAVVGIVAGIAVAFAARPWFEENIYQARAGGYRVFPLALATIALLAVITGLLAALVPAFVTARQNVVAALAGRRGITRSRKRWIALGVAMIALGTAIVLSGVFAIDTTVMLAGIIIGELGLVLCTPALVGFVARIGRLLPLAPRIALRDAARNRASAAPAISAVMAAVAGSVAIGLYFESDRAQQAAMYQPQLPIGYAQVWLPTFEDPQRSAAIAGQAEAALRSSLDVTEVRPLRSVRCPAGIGEEEHCTLQPVMVPEFECPYGKLAMQRGLTAEEQRRARADERCGFHQVYHVSEVVVDDGTALAAYTGATGDDLAAATAMLRAGGVVIRDPRYIKDGKTTLAAVRYDGETDEDPYETAPRFSFDAYLLTTGVSGGPIVSPAAVEQAGLTVGPTSRLVAATQRPPSQAEQDRFYAEMQQLEAAGNIENGPRLQFAGMLFVLMGVAALITIGAAAIGTGLATADGRPDLSTLAAVGASPRIRRGLSLSQSGVIAGLGSLLGALAGMGAAIAVIMAMNQRFADEWPAPPSHPVVVPWLNLAVALLVVPLIAVLGAGLFTRSRLPIERRA